jgi:micrococcal nuclease
MYTYKATLIKLIDVNTIDAEIDLGFGVFVRQRIRLFGISIPTTDDKSVVDIKNRLYELLGKEFIVTTMLNKRGKFGRVLGTVYSLVNDEVGENINDVLISEGYAKEYKLGSK